MRYLFACAGILFLLSGAAHADTHVQGPGKIVFETHVFTWSFQKQVWSKGQLIKVLTQYSGENDRLVREELEDGKGGLLEKILYEYSGDIVKKTFYNSAGKVIRTSVTTVRGNTSTETVKRIDGSVFMQFVTVCDPAGRVSEVRHLDEKAALVFRKEYIYNDKGNLSYIRNYNPDGSLAVEIRYQYKELDAKGDWLVREEYYSYGDVRNRPHEIVSRKTAAEAK